MSSTPEIDSIKINCKKLCSMHTLSENYYYLERCTRCKSILKINSDEVFLKKISEAIKTVKANDKINNTNEYGWLCDDITNINYRCSNINKEIKLLRTQLRDALCNTILCKC